MSKLSTNVDKYDGVLKNDHDFPGTIFDLSRFITGDARLIYYQVYGVNNKTGKFDPKVDSALNRIFEIREGEFKRGLPNGFTRIFEIGGRTLIGFW